MWDDACSDWGDENGSKIESMHCNCACFSVTRPCFGEARPKLLFDTDVLTFFVECCQAEFLPTHS